MDMSQQQSRLFASVFIFSVTSLFSGCVGEGVATTTVFKSDGSVQCDQGFDKSLSLNTQTQALSTVGIDVINQGCGTLTSASVTEVCGAPTLNINLFKIPTVSVPDANRLGYNSTALVQFEQADCGIASDGLTSLGGSSSTPPQSSPGNSNGGGNNNNNNNGGGANDVFGGIL